MPWLRMLSSVYLREQLNWFVMAITDLLSWDVIFGVLPHSGHSAFLVRCRIPFIASSSVLSRDPRPYAIEQLPCSIPRVDRVKAPMPIGTLWDLQSPTMVYNSDVFQVTNLFPFVLPPPLLSPPCTVAGHLSDSHWEGSDSSGHPGFPLPHCQYLVAHLVDLQSLSQVAAPGPALPDLLWNVRLHGHCLYRWVIAPRPRPPAHSPWRGAGDGLEGQTHSLAWVECPQLSLLFAFVARFSLFSQLLWAAPECFLGWGGRGTCENTREKWMSLQSRKWVARSGGGWGA